MEFVAMADVGYWHAIKSDVVALCSGGCCCKISHLGPHLPTCTSNGSYPAALRSIDQFNDPGRQGPLTFASFLPPFRSTSWRLPQFSEAETDVHVCDVNPLLVLPAMRFESPAIPATIACSIRSPFHLSHLFSPERGCGRQKTLRLGHCSTIQPTYFV